MNRDHATVNRPKRYRTATAAFPLVADGHKAHLPLEAELTRRSRGILTMAFRVDKVGGLVVPSLSTGAPVSVHWPDGHGPWGGARFLHRALPNLVTRPALSALFSLQNRLGGVSRHTPLGL